MIMWFISRHEPSNEQVELAQRAGYTLIKQPDVDAFSWNVPLGCVADAIAVVHPAAAMAVVESGRKVAVFENANRAPVGSKPEFYAVSLHIYNANGSVANQVSLEE